MTKISLIYLSVCATVSASAFGVMINVDNHSGALSNNQAYTATKSLIAAAALTVNNLPARTQATVPAPANQRAAAAFEQGEAARINNDLSGALAAYSQALSISQTEGFQQFESLVWQSVAHTYTQGKDLQQAQTAYKRAIKLAQQSRNTELLGIAQAELAQIYVNQGQLKQALPLYKTALVSLRQSGDHQTIQRVNQQTQKLEIALKPTPKTAQKPTEQPETTPKKAKPTAPIQVAIAPEAIIMPESAPASTRPQIQPMQDVLLTSDNDPEPPTLNESIVQPVSNDTM